MDLFSAGKRYGALLVLPLALASCSMLFPPKPVKHVAKAAAKPECLPGEFVQHLSLLNLALSDTSADMVAAGADMDIVQSYAVTLPKHPARHAKRLKEAVRQPVAVMECKTKADGSMQKLAAPFSPGSGSNPAVLELLDQMNARACVLNNVWLSTVTVRRGPPLVFNNMSLEQTRVVAHERLETVLKSVEKPAALTEAREQLQLTRVLIDGRQRDGAYLALENAKQALADAEHAPAEGDKEAIQVLLKELEDTESELHQSMPFSLYGGSK